MERLVVAMYPHLKQAAKQKIMTQYRNAANGQSNTPTNNATIEKDRVMLRQLLYSK